MRLYETIIFINFFPLHAPCTASVADGPTRTCNSRSIGSRVGMNWGLMNVVVVVSVLLF